MHILDHKIHCIRTFQVMQVKTLDDEFSITLSDNMVTVFCSLYKKTM